MSDIKKVLIVSYGPLSSDPRIQRQVTALKNSFRITTLAYSPMHDNEISFEQIYSLPPFSLLRKLKRFLWLITGKFDHFYWDDGKKKLVEKFGNGKFSVVIANDIPALPLALAIAGKEGKIYFDAHEYHPREWEDNLKWNLLYKRYVEFLCRKYIPMASAFSTVCESIAEEYEKFTRVKPFVITNATAYQELAPTEMEDNRIKIIHHGASIPSRKIETIIDVMKFLDDRFTLDLMLTELDVRYLASLKKRVEGHQRINFIAPVKGSEICKRINQYDIGIFLLPPTNFNYSYALPNKIFEFVQARLCVAISPNFEMARVVRNYDIGIVTNDFSPQGMAEAIKCLTKEKIMYHKNQCHLNARILSAEANIQKIKDIVMGLVSDKTF